MFNYIKIFLIILNFNCFENINQSYRNKNKNIKILYFVIINNIFIILL